jgi:outer membrane protein OmpA-like peptidoglycan-associated protein
MKRLSLLLLFVSTIIFPIVAQQEETLAEAVNRNTKGDNWFVGAGLSANVLWGEEDKYANPFKRIRPGLELQVGKWFNPYFGTRFQGTFGGLRGYQKMAYQGGVYLGPNDRHRQAWPYIFDDEVKYPGKNLFIGSGFMEAPEPLKPTYGWRGAKDAKGFWQDFNYATFTIDLMSNFSNLFYGHYSDRFVNLSPLVGLGVITAFDNGTTNPDFYYVVAKIGLNIDFRLTKSLSLYIEPKAYATNNELDGYVGTAMGDATSNLSAGVIWTFNKHYSNIGKLTLDEINRLNDKVNENRQRLDEHQDILDRHEQQIQDLYNRLKKCDEEKPVIVVDNPEKSIFPLNVFFTIDSYRINPQEQHKITAIYDFLMEKKDATIVLCGYADVKTAYPKYNLNLSKKRVEAVAAQLKAKGIPASRIELRWKGDTEQPFAINEQNRCVIAIEKR